MTTIVPEQRTAVGRYSRALEVILASAPTGAAVVVACTVPAATGPPLHVHAASDETSFVLSGVLLVRADDQVATIPEGGLVHVSHGMPHTFATTPGSPARFLVLHTPGGSGSPTSLRGHAVQQHGGPLPRDGNIGLARVPTITAQGGNHEQDRSAQARHRDRADRGTRRRARQGSRARHGARTCLGPSSVSRPCAATANGTSAAAAW